jgi:hypothetical protein
MWAVECCYRLCGLGEQDGSHDRPLSPRIKESSYTEKVMKVLDVPSTGKRGVVVGQGGRYGQVSRILAIPTNPRSTAQLAARQSLSTQAKIWRTLTQAQIAAWNTAAGAQPE